MGAEEGMKPFPGEYYFGAKMDRNGEGQNGGNLQGLEQNTGDQPGSQFGRRLVLGKRRTM